MTTRQLVQNKKAFHDYFIEERLEAGLVLQGWELKSLRDGRVQLKDSYVLLKNGEAFLIGILITPLNTVSTHITPDPQRTRKLLLHTRELARLKLAIEREGYTVVPLDLHWAHNRVKAEIAIAKGKAQHDKRETLKQREWAREKQRLLKPR
ncbi:MAG: SsrA-binding protein [Gammaproteobacteria bacterium RIFCSPHIGHO2_12_FULL_45_9]|nr:MAG: SsrA-binding protein [Gammaproteobacteria bacterium RIFCSPHIGHO2_12_FULL_45_9]